jgi:SagB-type dehydrogenase family enzyme
VANACPETAREFVSLLEAAALVTAAEDADPALAQWEFHDLLFHSRSRSGPHDYPVGGTYPFLGVIRPLPALKPCMPSEVLPLHVPDLERLVQCDPPFTRVVEDRRSFRVHGDEPITVDDLGEFLYRTARVDKIVKEDPVSLRHCETSERPYPTGGASYDLEVYVVVHRCTGLARGVYHYEPLDHGLRRVSRGGHPVDTLLRQAQRAAVLQSMPQLLIVLTSRFQRVSWKYRGLAYALTLKNVGVLLQTMYLVATAMDLAPCALGTGDASLFAQVIEEDYARESSVGEFVLGSRPGNRLRGGRPTSSRRPRAPDP